MIMSDEELYGTMAEYLAPNIEPNPEPIKAVVPKGCIL